MKKISKVITLNPAWLNKTELTLTGFRYDEKKNLVRLTTVITRDSNNYDDVQITNFGEKVNITAENLSKESMSTLKIGQKIKLEKVSEVSLYGQFNNELFVVGSTSVANG